MAQCKLGNSKQWLCDQAGCLMVFTKFIGKQIENSLYYILKVTYFSACQSGQMEEVPDRRHFGFQCASKYGMPHSTMETKWQSRVLAILGR